MKNSLKFLLIGTVVLVGCNKDDEEPEPIVGTWELDEATVEFEGYSFYGGNENHWIGESSYIITFNEDLTFQRELEDVPFTSGTDNLDEEGEWELDEDDLDLDTDDQEYDFLDYGFTIVEVDDQSLVLETSTGPVTLFPDSKLNEWFDDGTIGSDGAFTVTEAELDSLYDNFSEATEGLVTLEFDRQ